MASMGRVAHRFCDWKLGFVLRRITEKPSLRPAVAQSFCTHVLFVATVGWAIAPVFCVLDWIGKGPYCHIQSHGTSKPRDYPERFGAMKPQTLSLMPLHLVALGTA
jgi:hypothetical protein